MFNWWERRVQRQRELTSGVDADLALANRRRWMLGYSVIALGTALLAIDWVLRLPGWMHRVIASICCALLAVSLITWKWAQAEQTYLDKPEREKPSSLIKPE